MSKKQLPDYKQFAGRYFDAQTAAFINILRSTLTPETSESEFRISLDDYPAMAELSWKHKTDYYLYAWFQQMQTEIPDDIKQKVKGRISRQAARGLIRLNELLQVCRKFNEQGLKYVVIKGPHLAQLLYGKRAVKFSVDLDFLITSETDIDVFRRNLLKMGYDCLEKEMKGRKWKRKMFLLAKREMHFVKFGAGFVIDLHTRPFANTLFTRGLYKGFFSDVKQVMFEGMMIPVLPDEKYFVFLCHHGACHQFSRLAWLMDIKRFYELRKSAMDTEKIIRLAESLKVKKSLALAFYMMHLLTETGIPDYIKNELKNIRLFKALAAACFRSIAGKTGDDLMLNARITRLLYMLKITEGVIGKIDLIISILLRYCIKSFC